MSQIDPLLGIPFPGQGTPATTDTGGGGFDFLGGIMDGLSGIGESLGFIGEDGFDMEGFNTMMQGFTPLIGAYLSNKNANNAMSIARGQMEIDKTNIANQVAALEQNIADRNAIRAANQGADAIQTTANFRTLG